MLYRLFHLWAFFDSQAGIGATLWQFLKFPIIPHLCFHTARPTLGRFVPGYSLKGFPTAHLALNPVTAGACVRKANVMHDARCCSLRAVFSQRTWLLGEAMPCSNKKTCKFSLFPLHGFNLSFRSKAAVLARRDVSSSSWRCSTLCSFV